MVWAQRVLKDWRLFFERTNIEVFSKLPHEGTHTGRAGGGTALLPATLRHGALLENQNAAWILMGAARVVGMVTQKKESLSDRNFDALRLLANPDRVAMPDYDD